MKLKHVFAIVTLIALWIMSIRTYECVTPDCTHYVTTDGDLCPSCQAWLDSLPDMVAA